MTTRDRYEAAIAQAGDLLRWRSPLRAELWASRFVAEFDEDGVDEEAFGGLLEEDSGQEAALVAAALSAVGTPVRAGGSGPEWLARMGEVTCESAWYGKADRYGEQALAALTFRYRNGKEPHTVVVGIDQVHGGIAVDAAVEEPKFLDDLGLDPADPALVAERVLAAFSLLDILLGAPVADTLPPPRAFTLTRARSIPTHAQAAHGPQAPDLSEFPELADVPGAAEAYRVLMEFVGDRGVWWSPTRVSAFLTVWLPREAVLSGEGIDAMPEVVRAWTRRIADDPAIHDQIDTDAPGLPARMADESLAGLRKKLTQQQHPNP
ncbi:hypothetical protein ACIBEJ_32955 [Nonomuraea sp. NPDC050790]|uniref:hypothetical protein n=1 Tax=Nonomuraea sp. NPDC050790 TaxID=3364371 RepID=UPI0037B5D47E